METVVLYPSPAGGSLTPMVELAKLMLTHHSETISSIVILIPSPDPTTATSISTLSSSFPSISFQFLPSIPISKDDPSRSQKAVTSIFDLHRSNHPYVHDVLKSLSSSTTGVSAFIIDFFCHPSLELARNLGIPTYFFYASGASTLACFLNFPVFDKIAPVHVSFRDLKMSFEIPGLYTVPANQLPQPMQDRGPSYDEFVKVGESLAKGDGIIANTFEELDVLAVESLQHGTCLPGIPVPPVYCIGPLVGKSKEVEQKHECLTWLDSQPARSVVYLGFGRLGLFSKEQTREIALGLEKSEVRFLWVVRTSPSEEGSDDLESLLSEGFIKRTKGRGLVLKSWAPQSAVLGHEALGGFVTHCGWNSILEGVCNGVPMVAWPIYAEQRFNRIVLVQGIGIAVPMDENEDRFVSAEEVEKRVKQIVDPEDGVAVVIRKRMLELKGKARSALDEGGSAIVALRRLVESWKH